MKYKGFEILPVYGLCADWKLDKNGNVVSKKPTAKDIDYYEILDNGERWITGYSILECKNDINRLLTQLNVKTNPIAE
jgi:hypothetical protein